MKKIKKDLILACIVGILLSLGVGLISSAVTKNAIPNWYENLEKPFFSPPNWVFGPVWAFLYTLMGIAIGRVWFFGRRHLWGKTAIYHFLSQLILNGLWSLVFFGLRNPALSIVVIVTLWILIQRTIFWFRLVDKKASIMLYPYIVWVSFASILNAFIIYLN